MKNPSNADLEEQKKVLEQKKKILEKLQAEKAARDKEISNLKGQLEAQKQEVGSAMRYLDQLAKEHQAKLETLKKSGNPQAQAEIEMIESKLALYHTVRHAATRVEESAEAKNFASLASSALSLRLAEGEAVIANAKMVLKELTPAMQILRFAVGQPTQLSPVQNSLAIPIENKANSSQSFKQQLTATLHYFQEAENSTTTEEANLGYLKNLGGKEALQFAANTMKISALAGKINNLRNLHQTYGKDPLVKPLFPEPVEVTIPKMPPGMKPQKSPSKPLTGILKDLLGLGEK